MQWGIDQEGPARDAYSNKTDFIVNEIAFVDHPRILHSGASPDGLIGDDGLVEIKCPTTATHIETLLGGEINERHRLQMMWQLACTERKWCDYASFDPRMPEEMQVFVKRFERDDKEIHHLENEVEIFLHEVAATVAALKDKFNEE